MIRGSLHEEWVVVPKGKGILQSRLGAKFKESIIGGKLGNKFNILVDNDKDFLAFSNPILIDAVPKVVKAGNKQKHRRSNLGPTHFEKSLGK